MSISQQAIAVAEPFHPLAKQKAKVSQPSRPLAVGRDGTVREVRSSREDAFAGFGEEPEFLPYIPERG